MLGARRNTIHNLHYYQSLMASIRAAIETDTFEAFARARLGGPAA